MKKDFDFFSMKFHRKFCINPYMKLHFNLSRMDFYKDWITEQGGDPYPVIGNPDGKMSEKISNANYIAESDGTGEIFRLIGQYFPYATYDITLKELNGGAGFSFVSKADENELRLFLKNEDGKLSANKIFLHNGKIQNEESWNVDFEFFENMHFIVTCTKNAFNIFIANDKTASYVGTVVVPEFECISKRNVFINTYAAMYACGERVVVSSVESYLDSGISHADIKVMKYEDGTPIMNDGKLFMTSSVRNVSGGFQSVLSWNPSSCDMKMEGAFFFDYGDDEWNGDIASSVVYNRKTNEWYVWATAFSRGHILCHARSKGDLRYGINVLDATLMPTKQLSSDESFYGKEGDEDPDFTYDEKSGKWYMTICRTVAFEDRNRYRYFLFESDDPFDGYVYKDKTIVGSDTGGSIIRVNDKLYFVCGSDGSVRSGYHAYLLDNLSECHKMKFDFDDGGFRGWGTIVPVMCGNRTKFMWITFDRHKGHENNNWSYGNIYVFESDVMI